jgi:hypothetical protein
MGLWYYMSGPIGVLIWLDPKHFAELAQADHACAGAALVGSCDNGGSVEAGPALAFA